MIRHIITLIWNKKRQNYLLLLEIFLAFLILYGVFTFVSYNLNAYRTPLGFNTENTWVVKLEYDQDQDSTIIEEMKLSVKRELEALPEIATTGYFNEATPFSGYNWTMSNDDNGFTFETCIFFSDENCLDALGLTLVEGRWFNESDRHTKYRSAVISKPFWEKTFGSKPILDSVYSIDGEVKIVGIIEHYKYNGEFSEEKNATFLYMPPGSGETPNLVMSLNGDPEPALEEKINSIVAGITKRSDFTIENLESRRIQNSRQTWVPIVAMLSICGFLVLNVSLGLFGVLWYNISKRKAEIGLRRTIGATKGEISWQFVGEVLLVAFIGILIGAFFGLQLPMMQLFDIDWINYVYAALGAGAIILLLVLICALYPSYQASLTNPAIALHEE